MLINIINKAKAMNYMNAKGFTRSEGGWVGPEGDFVGDTKIIYCGRTLDVDMSDVPRSPYKFQVNGALFQGWFIDE